MSDNDTHLAEILPGLGSPHEFERAAALAKLVCSSDLDPSVISAVSDCLLDANPSVRELAVVVLAQVGSDGLEPLIVALGDAQPISVRVSAASGISRMGVNGQAAAEPLCKCLQSSDELLKWHSAFALSKIGKGAVSSLRRMLSAVDASVLPSVVTALGWIGADAHEAVEAIKGLTSSPSTTLRLASSSALIRITGDPSIGLTTLTRDLEDQDPGIRVAAVNSLGELGPLASESGAKITALLSDSSPKVRAAAALTLARIGVKGPQPIQSLSTLLQDEDVEVRGNAGIALSGFGSAAAGALPSLENLQGETDTRLATIGKAAWAAISKSDS